MQLSWSRGRWSCIIFEKGGTLLLGSFKRGPARQLMMRLTDCLRWWSRGSRIPCLKARRSLLFHQMIKKIRIFFSRGLYWRLWARGHFSHLSVDGEICFGRLGEKYFLFQTTTLINLKIKTCSRCLSDGCAIAHLLNRIRVLKGAEWI